MTQRFGNKQLIIDRYMEVLMSVEAASSKTHLRALWRLHNTIKAQVRGLKAMSVTPETYGGLLSFNLLSKILPEIQLIISQHIGDGVRNLENLMKLLLQELQARERSMAGELAPVKT